VLETLLGLQLSEEIGVGDELSRVTPKSKNEKKNRSRDKELDAQLKEAEAVTSKDEKKRIVSHIHSSPVDIF
jgi:hypothetical protein